MIKHKLRTPVSFDMISVTLRIEDHNKIKLKDKLLLLLETYKEKGQIAKHYFHQERYGNIFRFEVPTDTDAGHFVLKILIYPMDKAHNFFKVEFNPNMVASYRLVGYTNRRVSDGAARDDRGPIGQLG